MLFELIERNVLQFIDYVLQQLPETTIGYPENIVDTILNIITGTGYFMPLSDLALMLTIQIFITTWAVTWKAIQRVWDALPFV